MADFDDMLALRNGPILAALAPLAGKTGLSASEKAAVVGQVTPATLAAAPIVGPFAPIAGRPFNITIDGGAGVVAVVERKFTSDATWYVKYTDDLRKGVPPSFSDTESEAGVQYQVRVLAITGGTVTVRLSQ